MATASSADHYRAWRRTVDVVMRQEHRAGEKLFVDFPGQTIPIYDRRTRRGGLQAELFVAVLGASNYLYAEALASQGLDALGERRTSTPSSSSAAVPEIVVCDNLRSGVTPAAPLRARRQRHLSGDGRPLSHGRHPDPAL